MAAKRTTRNRPLSKALEEAQVIATPDDFEDDEFDGEDEDDDTDNVAPSAPDVLDEAIAEMAEPDEAEQVEPVMAGSTILHNRIEALETRVEKLVTLATALVKRQQKLDSQLNGERTVLGKVPKVRPPQSFAQQQPMTLSQDELYTDGIMAEIGAGGLEDDPIQFSIAQRNRRHAALNGKK